MAKSSVRIPEQRRQALLTHLRRKGVLSYRQLADFLGVSQMTIRRDVAVLEADGHLSTTAGGVRTAHRFLDVSGDDEVLDDGGPEYEAIARLAVSLVEDSMSIYLEGGPITRAMRPYFDELDDLTIVTNDLTTLQDFLDHPTARLLCIGGYLDQGKQVTSGRLAQLALAELCPNLSFLTSSNWDAAHGITTRDEAESAVKRAAGAVAGRSVLLAGSANYGRFSSYRALRLDEVDIVVTDEHLAPDLVGVLHDLDIDLLVAPGE